MFFAWRIFRQSSDKSFTDRSNTPQLPAHPICREVLKGQVTMVMMNSNIRPLAGLEAEIVELEEAIRDLPTWDRLLDTLRKLSTEAQDYHRNGNVQDARLTLNSAFRLVEQTRIELKKWNRSFCPTGRLESTDIKRSSWV
jgi:hypothetical protein